MRIILSKDDIKREINSPFNICLSRLDAISLVAILQRELMNENWSYGWIHIAEEDMTSSNVPVKAWDE